MKGLLWDHKLSNKSSRQPITENQRETHKEGKSHSDLRPSGLIRLPGVKRTPQGRKGVRQLL